MVFCPRDGVTKALKWSPEAWESSGDPALILKAQCHMATGLVLRCEAASWEMLHFSAITEDTERLGRWMLEMLRL